MRELLYGESRCFLFDLMADPKLEEWGILCDTVKDAVHLAGKGGNFRIRMQFSQVERFDFICKFAMEIGDCSIYVDELALFCSPHWMPDNMQNVIRLGRHQGVRFVATTQRPPDIHSLVLSQAKRWYLFQTHLPRDIQFLRQFVPDIERVLNLPVGECIVWSPTASVED